MVVGSFPLFLQLPPEIRHHIWDLAVRPVPGARHVHYFIIADHYTQHADPRYPIHGYFLRLGAEGRVNAGFKLAVPYGNVASGPNESVYLTDSGLWMASRESREAMERHFKKNEWWSQMPGPSQPKQLHKAGDFLGEMQVASSSSYVNAAGETNHITIQPWIDLVYFKPISLDDVDWWHHYAGDDVPLVDYRGEADSIPKPSFLGLDVAFDYDRGMYDVLAGRTVYHCAHVKGVHSMSIIDMIDVFHESAARTVWFVDHRLRRRGSPSGGSPLALQRELGHSSRDKGTLNTERQAFHSVNRTFTEVRRDDMMEWTAGDELEDKETVFDFFDLLESESNGRLEIQGSNRLKVLACEAMPGVASDPLPGRGACEICVKESADLAAKRKRPSTPCLDIWEGLDDYDIMEAMNLFD